MTTWSLSNARRFYSLIKGSSEVADQRFSLKQWFAGDAQSRRLRKPGCGHCYLRFFYLITLVASIGTICVTYMTAEHKPIELFSDTAHLIAPLNHSFTVIEHIIQKVCEDHK